MQQAGRAGEGVFARLRRRFGLEEGEDLAGVAGMRTLDGLRAQLDIRHREADRFIRNRGRGHCDALKRQRHAAAHGQDRLLAQPGDGDGGMVDALDRTQPVADQLQLGIELRAACQLACQLCEISRPLHRRAAQVPDG
jgi:hypothetical protein